MRRSLRKDNKEKNKRSAGLGKRGIAKKRSRLSIVKVLTVILSFGVFIFSFLFYTWVHMQVVHISYEMAQAKGLENECLEVNKKLKTEVATLKTPLRIKKLAAAKLGLSVPEKDQVIIIK